MMRAWIVVAMASGSVLRCGEDIVCAGLFEYDEATDQCICPAGTMLDAITETCVMATDAGPDGATDTGSDAPSDTFVPACDGPGDCPERDNATRTCEGNTCGFECDADWGDCDGDASNGCEADLTSDVRHCGICADSCDGLLCVDRTCVDGVVQICTGASHNCVRRASGSVACWGDNSSGQLGGGTFNDSVSPVEVGIEDAVDIDCGMSNLFAAAVAAVSCAVRRDGTVWCWGYGANGALGNGVLLDSNVPVEVESVTGASSVSVGVGHVCATTSGATWCWGQFVSDEITSSPIQLPGVRAGTVRAAEGRCLLSRENTVSCWDSSLVIEDKGLEAVQSLMSAWGHACAVLPDETVWCWGTNQFGQLGTDTPVGTEVRDAPAQVQGPLRAVSVSGHGLGTCALTSAGEALCWGLDVRQDPAVSGPVPYRLTGAPPLVDIDFGRMHACGVLRTGEVACWGSNGGLLGRDEPGHSPTLLLVPGLP